MDELRGRATSSRIPVEVLIVILAVLFVVVVAIPVVAIIAINHIVDHNKHGSPEPDWKEGYDD